MIHLHYTQNTLPQYIRKLDNLQSREKTNYIKPTVSLLNHNFFPKKRLLGEVTKLSKHVNIIPGFGLDVSIKVQGSLSMPGYELNFLDPTKIVKTFIHILSKRNREEWMLTLVEYLVDAGFPIHSLGTLTNRIGMPLWAIPVSQIIREVCLISEIDTSITDFYTEVVMPFENKTRCYIPEISSDVLDFIPNSDKTVISINACDLIRAQELLLIGTDYFNPRKISKAFVDETTSPDLKRRFNELDIEMIDTKFVSV